MISESSLTITRTHPVQAGEPVVYTQSALSLASAAPVHSSSSSSSSSSFALYRVMHTDTRLTVPYYCAQRSDLSLMHHCAQLDARLCIAAAC
eukprot:20921-Heterococcus_DN1.PRE.3